MIRLSRIVPVLVVMLATIFAGQAFGIPGKALVVGYDIPYSSLRLYQELDAIFTESVDYTSNPPVGLISSMLAATEYDQIWLFDCTRTLKLTHGPDLQALADWHSTHLNLVLDGRAYALDQMDPGDPQEWAFVENIATNFAKWGGGLWIGVDHVYYGGDAYNYAQNGNALLSYLGYDLFYLGYSDPIDAGETGHPHLAAPNSVAPSDLNWGTVLNSVSGAPTGFQAPNVVLVPVAWNTSGETYISATEAPPVGVLSGGNLLILLFAMLGLGLLAVSRYRLSKLST